jgi:hypothetical protein
MDHPDTLKEDASDYIETKVKLIKLKTIDKAGSAISGAIAGVLIALFGFFLLLFLSLSAAFGISSISGRPFLGFLIVGLFYGLLIAGIIFFKEKMLTMPIIQMLLKRFYYIRPDEEKADDRIKEEKKEAIKSGS